jgi:hypothetical protein
VAESSHARESDDVGAIYRASTTSSVAAASDSPCLDVTGESCLRNPLREICTVGSVREGISRWCHGGPKRARSWKRRTQPRKTYSPSGLLYSERRDVTPTERPIINCLACGRAKIPGNCSAHDSVGGQAWIWSTKHKVGFELPIEAHGLIQIELRYWEDLMIPSGSQKVKHACFDPVIVG